jgi:hypothetical protein
MSDGCHNTLNCGSCAAGYSCVNNACVAGCVAKTCATGGYTCGTNIPDGCGGTIASCGSAGACAGSGQVCTTSNTCCTPTTCAAQGKTCGQIFDGCGDAIDCGSCSAGQTCSSSNVCATCTPTTCLAQGKNCGTISDGCGSTINCGSSCSSGQSCGGGGTPNVCGSGVTTTTQAFSAGALLIPMDQCYNPDYAASADYVSNGTTCAAGSKFACYANYTSGNVRLPYGLMYLLAENNIPVTIILNPKKLGLGDADFSVTPPTGSTTQTSSYLKWSSSQYTLTSTAMTCGTNTVYYGGMPFLVDAPFAAQALQIITSYNTAHSSTSFSAVPLHVINYPFTAPVLGVMGSRPKPVLIDGSPLDTFFDESNIPNVAPPGTTYLTINGSAPNFTYTWPSAYLGAHPGCPGDLCSTLTYVPSGYATQRIADVMWVHNPQYNQWSDIGTWYAMGGTAMVVADATGWEASGVGGVGGGLTQAANGAQKGPYCATVAVSGTNFNSTPGPSTEYPASNKFLQIGDMDLFVHGVGGGDGSAYSFTSTPSAKTEALTNTVNYTAITGHPTVNGNQAVGSVVYLGSLNSWHGGSSGKDAGLHIMYNSLLTGTDGLPAPPYTPSELSRSPVTGGPGGVYYVGTFNWYIPLNPTLPGNPLYNAPVSNYPYVTGHFREFKPVTTTGLVSNTCDPNDSTSACNWDTANNIPAWSSRKVFVGTQSGSTYSLSTASSMTTDTTISYISSHIGQFMGGVDYGAAAYLQAKTNSPVPGATTRPPLVYVGARDGMLHAFCADTTGSGCYGIARGNEVWAFIPKAVKSVLDTAVTNSDFSQVNVGGLLHAIDASDTWNGAAPASYKTVLIGGTREGSSIFALDVSDPNPANVNTDGKLKLLWESNGLVANTGVVTQQMGQTRGAALAYTNKSAAVIVTSSVYNGTTGTASGINTYVIRLNDGKVMAFDQKLYTRQEPTVGGSTAQILNEAPPAATVIDLSNPQDGTDETFLVADLEGVVRKFTIDPTNLTFTGSPVVVFDTSFKCSPTTLACQPIGASVSIGKYGSANAFGGYVNTGGADWARSATTHSWTFGFDLKQTTTSASFLARDLGTVTPPVSTVGGGTSVAWPLRSYSPVSIAGTDVYTVATTLSIGTINSLIQPQLFPGTYGQVERWGNANTSTPDTSAYLFINQGQNFAGGGSPVVEYDAGQAGQQANGGQLALVGASTNDRVVLTAGATSLHNAQYAVSLTPGGIRPFSVMTWFDLGN